MADIFKQAVPKIHSGGSATRPTVAATSDVTTEWRRKCPPAPRDWCSAWGTGVQHTRDWCLAQGTTQYLYMNSMTGHWLWKPTTFTTSPNRYRYKQDGLVITTSYSSPSSACNKKNGAELLFLQKTKQNKHRNSSKSLFDRFLSTIKCCSDTSYADSASLFLHFQSH